MDTSILVTLICAVLGSSVLTTLVNRLFERKDKKSALEVARDKAIMYCLLVVFKIEARRLIQSDEPIGRKDWNQLTDMYNTYKDMGGDGYADILYEQAKEKFSNAIAKGNIK